MEDIVCLGLNHETAPIDVREMVALTSRERKKAVQKFTELDYINGCVILGTCNRCELYFSTTAPENSKNRAVNYLLDEAWNPEKLQESLYFYQGREAVEHIFQVACGADSMIKGEPEILKQVKEAYNTSCEQDCCDTYLHEVFHRALRTGKRARSETEISQHAASIGYAAVEKAREQLDEIADSSMLVIGAGDMGRAVMKNMMERGVDSPVIANRSYERSARLAQKYSGEAIPIAKLPDKIDNFDIVISCTAAPHYIIKRERHGEGLKQCSGSQLLIDLAVPRDIEPEVEEITGVRLFMIDELEEVVNNGLEERSQALNRVEDIIAEECKDYFCWLKKRQAVPLIKAMQKKGEKIREAELERAFAELEEYRGDISSREKEIMQQLSRQIVKKMLHHPVIETKKMLYEEELCADESILRTVARLFKVDTENEF